MELSRELVAGKLRRWEKYLYNFQLPGWDSIPDFGLYMDQIIGLLTEYLDYLPPEIKSDRIITAATINNYVRMKIMPEPQNKKYYRVHIAYLIIICTLKQSLNIATIQKIIPLQLSEADICRIYTSYAERHRAAADYFIEQVRIFVQPLLNNDSGSERVSDELIFSAAILSGLSRLLAEKIISLEGLNPKSDGVDLSIPERKRREEA